MINPHITRMQFVWEGPFQAGARRSFLLFVETKLQLNPQHPDFDYNAVNSIISDLEAYKNSNNRQFDFYRIVSIADEQLV